MSNADGSIRFTRKVYSKYITIILTKPEREDGTCAQRQELHLPVTLRYQWRTPVNVM
jgi:hypothetical protein